MAELSEIQAMARELNLTNIAGGKIDLSKETVSNTDYLYEILRQELQFRKEKKQKLLQTGSRIPWKTFDHGAVCSGLEWQLEKIFRTDFRNTQQNIMIVGDCATGKTALAAEIGNYAIRRNAVTTYTTAEELLIAAQEKKALWQKLLKSDLVLIDDLFYVTPSEEELIRLYRAIMFLQETRSMLFISNRPLSAWSQMPVDSHVIATLQQRIMANAYLIHL